MERSIALFSGASLILKVKILICSFMTKLMGGMLKNKAKTYIHSCKVCCPCYFKLLQQMGSSDVTLCIFAYQAVHEPGVKARCMVGKNIGLKEPNH